MTARRSSIRGWRAGGRPLASVALAAVALAAVACGYLGEKGEEPKGDKNQPSSGVGVFVKQDFDCTLDLTQPIMVPSPRRIANGEPWVIREDGAWKMWFEQRSETGRGTLQYTTFSLVKAADDCRTYDVPIGPVQEVFAAPARGWESEDDSGEQTGVGAPTILHESGGYRMWYAGGAWAGIGTAESADGLRWTRKDASGNSDGRDPGAVRPLLVPDQAWENGTIGSPAVLFHEGLYRMWYDGNVMEQRAIGYADSPDGLVWTKRDAAGRSSATDPGRVEPVFLSPLPGCVVTDTERCGTKWEFDYPTDPYGRVGAPTVLVHRSPLRTYYLMYYTGNLLGRVSLAMNDMDASIGIAWSMDGLTWTKAPDYSIPETTAMEINPIMNEKLPIAIGPAVEGSSNNHSALSIVDEAGPMVVEVPEDLSFYMFWQQVDAINQLRGLNGIGFAFAKNASN